MRGGRRRGRGEADPPIPLAPVDLLAGIAPGVELTADDLPAGIHPDDDRPSPATTTVAETGRLLRSGDRTVRRLIRTPGIEPGGDAGEAPTDVARAGVLPPTPHKPGE
jgi:hypothetical protein